MVCHNRLCIYQKNDICILNIIELDINECIYPNLPEYILETEKEKARERYEEDDG